MPTLAEQVVRSLGARGETLAVAESLTGGLLAATIVAVPGASVVFRGGLVVYAADLKASLAGVPSELLAQRGTVDPDVAAALAVGAQLRCAADWGLSTTGVAGPDPVASPLGEIPVGTVWLGLAGPLGTGGARDVRTHSLTLPGDRATIRAATVDAAIALLAEFIAA